MHMADALISPAVGGTLRPLLTSVGRRFAPHGGTNRRPLVIYLIIIFNIPQSLLRLN